MRISSIVILLALLALVAGGCPKRQTSKRLVYVPSPPAAAQPAPKQQSGVLIIAPPAKASPSQPARKSQEAQISSPPPAPAPKRHPAPNEPSPPVPDTAAEPAPASAAPQLEPLQSAAQQGQLEAKIASLRDTLRQRITRLHSRRLSKDDQRTLEEGELLLTQANQAMQEGDLQQSLSLAQKADLLVSAIENGH